MTIIKIMIANIREGEIVEIMTTAMDVDSGPPLFANAWERMGENIIACMQAKVHCLLLIIVALRVDPTVFLASTWKT